MTDPCCHGAISIQKSDSATLYAIDTETGALKELKRYPPGKNPNRVEIVGLVKATPQGLPAPSAR